MRCGLDINPVEMARICQRAENQFVGMNCGILDQFTSSVGCVGGALLLDCRELTSQQVPIPADISIVICDTRTKRELTGTEYPQRRAHCERGAMILGSTIPGIKALRDVTLDQYKLHEDQLPPVVRQRCRFIIEENQRVLEMSAALSSGEVGKISHLTRASYQGARELFEIVSPEMELMMEAMLNAPGVIGARQAGAGFGGCMVSFVHSTEVPQFTAHVSKAYLKSTQIEPQVYPVSGEEA
jgi:galactokinase